MTTRAQFVQKAVAAGLSDEDIRKAMADRRSKLGAFDDDAQPAATAPAPAPAQAAAQGPAAKRISLGEMFFPATNEHALKHGNSPSLGRYGNVAKDLISMPKRFLDANTAIASGDPDKVIEAATRTQANGVGDAIAREAPLMLMPGGQVRGVGIAQRIMSGAGRGAAEAIPSAALHQVTAEDGSVKEGLKEVATGGILRGGMEGAGRIVDAAVPYLKRGVSKLSEVSQDALEAVTNKATGKQNLQEYAKAAKRFGTADGGTDMLPMAEELGHRVEAENAARTAQVEGARAAQKTGLEQDALTLRNSLAGGRAKRIGELSPGNQGENIKQSIESAKPVMQRTYVEGDRAAYNGLRAAPTATKKVQRFGVDDEPTLMPDGQGGLVEGERTARSVMEEVPVLPGRIDEVLEEFKALSPAQGVAKITPAAAKAIKSIGMTAERAKTVDDLVDLKWQVRHMQASGGYEGALFDATRDDLALARVLEKIREVEVESITNASPKLAKWVIELVDKNNALYGRTLEVLRKGDQKFRLVQNSENIIGRIKELGPEEARALQAEAKANKTLQPYVAELQKGFVDDLLLSSVKNGEFSPEMLSKSWAGMTDDLKKAWLPEDVITRMDKAIAKGTKEIKDPELVGKTLFSKLGNEFLADKKIANITGGAYKEALAELQTLDELFGTDYTKQAIAAHRGKQLQLGETGKLPGVGNIRTGKAQAMATAGGAAGAPIGAGIGAPAGYAAGLFAQSPAGAVLMYRTLNRLADLSVSEPAKAAASQALRSSTFQPKAKRIY